MFYFCTLPTLSKEISDLLGENISVVKPEAEFVDTVINVLGSDFEIDNYPLDYDKEDTEAEQAVAVFPKNKVTVTNFKLAQQIAGVPIIAEFTQPQQDTQSLQCTNWQEIEGWLKEFLPKLQTTLKETDIVNYAAKLFSSVEGNVMRLVHRLYYKENGKWVEKTTVREIDESKAPAWAKEGLSSKEKDVTDRYCKKLELII